MHSVHEGHYSRGSEPLKANSAQEAVDYAAQKFKAAFHPNPQSDLTGSVSILLKRQTKAYQNVDPSAQHEKALPCSFYRHLLKSATTQFHTGVTQLCIGALFFAMCSCEYTKVTGDRHTNTITLGDIRFYHNKRLLPHNDPNLHLADIVSITFCYQKWDQCDDTITQHRTLDPVLCPVKAWAYTVRRLLRLPSSSLSTTVFTFMNPVMGTICRFTESGLLALFRATARAMGEDEL